MLPDAHTRYPDSDTDTILETRSSKFGSELTPAPIAKLEDFKQTHVKLGVLLLDVDDILPHINDDRSRVQSPLKNFDILIPVLCFAQALGVELGIVSSRNQSRHIDWNKEGLVTAEDIISYFQSNDVTINADLVFMPETVQEIKQPLLSQYNEIKDELNCLKELHLNTYKGEKYAVMAIDRISGLEDSKTEIKDILRLSDKNLALITALDRLKLPTENENRSFAAILSDSPKQAADAQEQNFVGIAVPLVDKTGQYRHITDITFITGDEEQGIKVLADLLGLNQFINLMAITPVK